MKLIDTPPVWLVFFLALGWLQARWVPLVDFGSWGSSVGAGLTAIGIGLILVAAMEFLRHRTTIVPHEQPSAFIDTGIFRMSRNPIYLGDVFVLIGLSLRWDALLSLVAVPLFIWIIRTRFIEGEEARLRAKFGATFDSYAARVRRWI